MSYSVLRCFEYSFFCDYPKCSDFETLHTGDRVGDIFVHNTQTAFKSAKYHRVKGKTYCDKCFRKMKEKAESEEE